MTAAVDELLARARSRLQRLTPHEAVSAMERGGLLVDIRPADQRATEGTVPGAVVVGRNVLEWRLDPTSPDRIPEVTDHDRQVILLCSEGYATSLAAATLQDLGLHGATDVVGGFQAWVAAGLPVTPGP